MMMKLGDRITQSKEKWDEAGMRGKRGRGVGRER